MNIFFHKRQYVYNLFSDKHGLNFEFNTGEFHLKYVDGRSWIAKELHGNFKYDVSFIWMCLYVIYGNYSAE